VVDSTDQSLLVLPFSRLHGEKGSALLLALTAVLVTTMSVLLLAGLIRQRREVFGLEDRNIILTSLADTAMAESLAEMDRNRNFQGIVERKFGRGRISSTVSIEDVDARLLVARAQFSGWVMLIEAHIDVRWEHPRIISWTSRQGPESRF